MATTKEPETIQARYYKVLCGIKNPELDGWNPHFESKFSTLKTVLKTIDDACKKEKIQYLQEIRENQMDTMLIDENGERFCLSTYSIPTFDNPQKLGSYITYLRRYMALVDFNIVGDPDDDGNIAAAEIDKQLSNQAKAKNENNKRAAYLKRVEDLQAEAIALGIKQEGIQSYVQAKYKKAWADLTADELQEIGVYIKGLINDKNGL